MIIKEFKSRDQLYQTLACDMLNIMPRKSEIVDDPFSLIISGGRSPIILHRLLVEQSINVKTDWDNISVFFSDERCVPSDNELSNYAMAKRTLFSPLGLSENHVYRIKGDNKPDEAAAEYHQQVDNFLNQQKYFALALLGMGSDGHTASLFPGSPALEVQDLFAVSTDPGPEGKERVTLTYKALNSSKKIWVMVTGKDKIKVLKKALRPESNYMNYPVKALSPLEELTFYCTP